MIMDTDTKALYHTAAGKRCPAYTPPAVLPLLALFSALLNNYAAQAMDGKIYAEVFPMNKKTYIGYAAAAAVLLAVIFAGMRSGGGGFKIREFSPQNEAARSAEIRCVISRSAVSEDIVGTPLAPGDYPFVFSPEIAGFGRWTAPDTFVLTPSGGLAAACIIRRSAE